LAVNCKTGGHDGAALNIHPVVHAGKRVVRVPYLAVNGFLIEALAPLEEQHFLLRQDTVSQPKFSLLVVGLCLQLDRDS